MKKIILYLVIWIPAFAGMTLLLSFGSAQDLMAQDPPSGYTAHYRFRMWNEGAYPTADSVNQNLIDIDQTVYNRQLAMDSIRNAFNVLHVFSTGLFKTDVNVLGTGTHGDFRFGTYYGAAFTLKTQNTGRIIIGSTGDVTIGSVEGTGDKTLFVKNIFGAGIIRITNSIGTDTLRVDSEGDLNIGGNNNVWLGNSDYGYRRALYMGNLDALIGTFATEMNTNDANIEDTLWSKGRLLFDTLMQGQIYFEGYDMYIKNKKTSGYLKIIGEGTNKGIILDASGTGGTQAYWIGPGTTSFSWTKNTGAVSYPMAVLDSIAMTFGNSTGLPKIIYDGPSLSKVHYSFAGDEKTGLFRIAGDSVAVVSGGTKILIVGNKTITFSEEPNFISGNITGGQGLNLSSITNFPVVPASNNPYTWLTVRVADGTVCYLPVWK